jgi:hypothetical protein
VLKTSYGVLVGREDVAHRVLTDEVNFSAREYWLRMDASRMPMHLGMDQKPVHKAVCPLKHGAVADAEPNAATEPSDAKYVEAAKRGTIDYESESVANPLVARTSRSEAFCLAYAETKKLLDASASESAQRKVTDLFVVGERVIARLSEIWFGLPDGKHMMHGGLPVGLADTPRCPADFTYAAQYFFRPNPDEWTIGLSMARGAQIEQAAARLVAEQTSRATADQHHFIRDLSQAVAGTCSKNREGLVVRALVGAVDGFVAANWGSFVTTMAAWVRSQELWQVQLLCEVDILYLSELASKVELPQIDPSKYTQVVPPELADALEGRLHRSDLVASVVKALMVLPVPAWLHRTALEATDLAGTPIAPGDRIVLNLSSISLSQRNPNMLFGGVYSSNKGAGQGQTPHHACPAQEMAMGVLLGMIVAVLERKSIRAEGPLALTFDAQSSSSDSRA